MTLALPSHAYARLLAVLKDRIRGAGSSVADPAARLSYPRTTAQFGWSRDVLLNQIQAHAHERPVKEKKSHNITLALLESLAKQADDILKCRYNLEFLGIGEAIRER